MANTNLKSNIEIDGFEIYQDDKEGYSIVSKKTNKEYCLLEGESYHGNTTSDIVFIMELDPECGYARLVNFCFGAGFVQDSLKAAASYITDFENGNKTDLQSNFNVW